MHCAQLRPACHAVLWLHSCQSSAQSANSPCQAADQQPAVQPDFTRMLTLHHVPDAGWLMRLRSCVRVTAEGKTAVEAVSTVQLPEHSNFWFPADASSPCGGFCLLFSQTSAGTQPLLWASEGQSVSTLPPIWASAKGFSISWLPGTGPARLVSRADHWLLEDFTSSVAIEQGAQIAVLRTDSILLAESELLPKAAWPLDVASTSSPDRSFMAVIKPGSLAVLALEDCCTVLQLEWPFAADQLDFSEFIDLGSSARFSMLWSPDSQALYVGSASHGQHHVCSLQRRCWLDLRQALPSLPQPLSKHTSGIGWGRQGLLVSQLAGPSMPQSADLPSHTVVEPVPLPQPGAAGGSTALPTAVSGHVLAASYSPDLAWMALGVMEWSPEHCVLSRGNNLMSVQLVRCKTGRVAASWVPERLHSDPPQLLWARGGNRLLCLCSDVCDGILLGFEGEQ